MDKIVIELDSKKKAAFKKKADSEGHTMAFLLRSFIARYVNGPQTEKAG